MFCAGILVFTLSAAQSARELIPAEGWLPQWTASYDVIAYQGDDLFFLINGGADLYMEYGFADVAAVELKHPDLGALYVEVYRMDSDSAAAGIFSLRKGNLQVEAGAALWRAFAADAMHLWRGNFYVSASGNGLKEDKRQEVFDALTAHFLNQTTSGHKLPLMLKHLPDPGSTRFSYIMGPLALGNIYSFGPGNLFQISEGVVAEQDDHRLFVFHYPNAQKVADVFAQVLQFMQTTNRFSNFSELRQGFSVTDRNGNVLQGSLSENLIRLSLQL